MSVQLRGEIIFLEGQCRIEDAEPLVVILTEGTAKAVDLTQAGHMHTAVLQVLLAFRPAIVGPAEDSFVKQFLEPILKTHSPKIDLT